MYENYKNQHPIDTTALDAEHDVSYSSGPFALSTPGGGLYKMGVFPYLMPVWHTDWRDEAFMYSGARLDHGRRKYALKFHTTRTTGTIRTARGIRSM